jgi:SAM-dependent methyltransferase
MLRTLLAHPLARGLDIDDPRTTEVRRQIVQENAFLRHIYAEWYQGLAAALPEVGGPVVELGSGAGFLRRYIPDLITTELFPVSGISAVMDGQQLPFAAHSVRAIVMTNVLHHLPQPRRFFAEAARCMRPGGRLLMIEPWVTPWSTLIYSRLHHEPFAPHAPEWDFPPSGPLSGANGALPWMLFVRDREQFRRAFPMWQIVQIRPMMPFRYLVSGGVSMRSLMPGWASGGWRMLEHWLEPWADQLAMFCQIVLEYTPAAPQTTNPEERRDTNQ